MVVGLLSVVPADAKVSEVGDTRIDYRTFSTGNDCVRVEYVQYETMEVRCK